MYLRLAFSIAISSRPQILIIDEALAVGDTIFQHRCLRRIKQMQEQGTTCLFVSHDPTLFRGLCSRAILLNAGRMLIDAAPVVALNHYQRVIMSREAAYDAGAKGATDTKVKPSFDLEAARARLQYAYRHGDRRAEVVGAELLDADDAPVEYVISGMAVKVRVRILFHTDSEDPVCGFMIRNRHGANIYGTNTTNCGHDLGAAQAGEIVEVTFDFNCWLGQGHYFVSVAAHTPDGISFDWLDAVIFFRVSCPVEMEGIANLNAGVSAQRLVSASPEPTLAQA